VNESTSDSSRSIILAWLAEQLAGETPIPQRRILSRAAGLFYGSGAVLVVAGILADHSSQTRLEIAVPVIAFAFIGASIMIAFPELIPSGVFPYIVAAGTLLITAVAYADNSQRSAYVLLYAWAAVYAFYFFPLSVALLETLWISIAAVAGMLLRGGGSLSFSFWLMITGTCLVGGLVIRHLITRLRDQAQRDVLTGLYNRLSLQDHIERDQRRATRTGEPLSVMMLDLDNFKQLNDRFGHLEGDRYLQEAARAWKAELRQSDVIARFGGDEFVVLMPACSLENARSVADRLRRVMPDGLTASAGVAQWDGEQDVLTLITCVDEAMYQAKVAGRNRTVVVTGSGAP
jgi:diguanylate cyclase (GGDEF)-like protein